MFPCDKCGECCRQLNKSSAYAMLDRGDGTCKYLKDNLCQIYDQRPIICQVDRCYDLFYKELMTREQFYELNRSVCIKLKNHQL